MSELAYRLDGEHFELPSNASGWRVRKMKARGAPEVVYSQDGIPLFLPIDADIDDLRREARAEGRYRLDPVDGRKRVIDGSPAAYVCVHPRDAAASSSQAAMPATAAVDHAVLEAMRINTELARAVIENFPMMLESAAVLIRAAGSAGMPQRAPYVDVIDMDRRTVHHRNAEPADRVVSSDGGAETLLEGVLNAVAPAIGTAIAGRFQGAPDQANAQNDDRHVVPEDSAPTTAAATTPGSTSTSGSGSPPPAPAPTGEPPNEAAQTARPQRSEPRRTTATAISTRPAAVDVADDVHGPDSGGLTRFAEIMDALTTHEAVMAGAIVAQLTPVHQRAWLAELRMLPFPEAVASVRAVLASSATERRSSGGANQPTDPLRRGTT